MTELSPETRQFIREHRLDDPRQLALQARKYPAVDMSEAVVQIAGRQAAAIKIPTWHATEDIRYPRHLPMEQCSSELTARYKASLLEGQQLTDLTGGFGVDCAFLSARFREAVYVERQEELCTLARHNFPLLGLPHIRVVNSDGTDYLATMPRTDTIYLDPARRDGHGGKTVAIADCEPDVSALEPLLLAKAEDVLVKLSPMLDLGNAFRELKNIAEAHVVSVNNECKELLLLLRKNVPQEVPIHCVNLTPHARQQFSFTREQEKAATATYARQLGQYLYEPNVSLLKAGAYQVLTSAFPVAKLHPNSHLYTSAQWIPDFPGRGFCVEGICRFNKKELKQLLGERKKANITTRNFPATVADLRKRLKLAEGGDDYLFATTLWDESKVLVLCRKKK